MSNREFCIARRKSERPAFLRVLKAVPQGRLDYRPDPKARNAGDLAWLFAVEEAALVSVLDTGVVDWKDETAPASIDDIVAAYEKSSNEVDERLAKLDDDGWKKQARFMMGGAPAWEATIGEFVWGFLFDGIHHRGQLSTYLRPMGSKIPPIYGPTADE